MAANSDGLATPQTAMSRRSAKPAASSGAPFSSRRSDGRMRAWKIGASGRRRCEGADGFLRRRRPVHAREDEGVGAPRGRDRLAQASGRRQAAAAEGIARVEQEQVHVAAHREVLEPVVEKEEVRAEVGRAPRRVDAPLADDDEDAGGGRGRARPARRRRRPAETRAPSPALTTTTPRDRRP